jgi:cystathionine beta-synthase
MSKVYSDQWMEDQGFFDSEHEVSVKTVQYIK